MGWEGLNGMAGLNGWKVEEIGDLRGFTVEWAEPGKFYLSRRNVIYRSETLAPPFDRVAAVEAPAWRALASRLRLAQRLLRFTVTNVLPLDNGELFVTFDRSVGVIRDGQYVGIRGMRRPCRVLRSAAAVAQDGSVTFGEYFANPERGEVHVYRRTPGSDGVETATVFAAGSIRHVHGVYRDGSSSDLYCLSGDLPEECRISKTSDGFATLERVGGGDETWRAVSLIFTDDAIYYGTDAEFRANEIYRIDRRSGERVALGEVNGTVFYSQRVGNEIFFTTTAENAPAQKENVAALWCLSSAGKLEEVVRFSKDRWHGKLFQYGTISLPNGPGLADQLLFSLVAVKGDGRTFRLVRG